MTTIGERARHRIALQKLVKESDELGEPVDVWTNVWVNVPAKIRGLGGREQSVAEQQDGILTHEITIRYLPCPPDQKMRAVECGKIFNIESITDPDGNGRDLVLRCRELGV